MKKHYMYHHPGMIYAIDVYARNVTDVYRQMREYFGFNRLPPGRCAWIKAG